MKRSFGGFLIIFLLSVFSAATAAAADPYLDAGFKSEVVADLQGEIQIGGSIAIGPGGDWGDSLYVLTTPVFKYGTAAPELAKIWKIDRQTGNTSILTTFPSRFDADPGKRARAFYTSGRIPPQAVITGSLEFDRKLVLGAVDAAGNPGLYLTSADSGRIYRVDPDGSITVVHNLRAALNLTANDDPLGIVFDRAGPLRPALYPDPEWQAGMYVVITGEGYPHTYRVIQYTSLNPVKFSTFVQGTGGGGSAAFAPTLNGDFGSDLYVLSGAATSHIHKTSKSGTISDFSNFTTLASSTGIAFSASGPFSGALYVGHGKTGTTAGTIFKISANGVSSLFATGIGGQGMTFESADSLLIAGNTEIFRITPKNTAPAAAAGPDQTVNCAGVNGTSVQLDGSGSSDTDQDPLTYTWKETGTIIGSGVKPAVSLSPGVHAITLTVDDGREGTASDDLVVTILDSAAPVTIVQGIAGIAGTNGWYTSDVGLNLEAADNCSGVKEVHYLLDGLETTIPGGTASVTITPEAVHSFSYFAKDNSGNAETAHALPVNIDKTPPSVSATATPAPNANGWTDADVTVTFTCSDALSGVLSCPDPVIMTGEGAGQQVTRTIMDQAGNSTSASVVLNIDKTAPVLTLTASPNILWPPNHKMVNVIVGGGTSDLSGSASVVFTVIDEYGRVQPAVSGFNSVIPLEAWRNGTDMDGRVYTIRAIATDKAGNQSTASTTVVVPHDMR